jgi:unsaturated rhamnogalacturonyl hydrolase
MAWLLLLSTIACTAAISQDAQESPSEAKLGRGDTVFLDAWYNSQKRPDASGKQVYFHYKWDDKSDSGYSNLGQVFKNSGAETRTLYTAPTIAALRQAQVYIIVSPDIPVKNPNPHYMQKQDAAQIAEWVKAGGVLMIMENDPANADIDHLNALSELFGIHYNKVVRNHVDGEKFEMGKIPLNGNGPIFHQSHTIFMKDICTISINPPARPALRDRGDILMAVAKYGRGTVFATVDPWLYNEYTNGRLPATYDNDAAGKELVRWILHQVPK